MGRIEITSYNEGDIKGLIPIHRKAFKGYMNASLGKKYVENFLTWFMHYKGSITLKATLDGELCGYVVGAPIGYDATMNSDLFTKALFSIITHPFIIFHKNFVHAAIAKFKILLGKKPVKITITNPKGNGISLVGIAVGPSASGNGVGSKLMAEFEKRAREMQLDYMRLSVFNDNKRAIEVYEKSGWKIMQEGGNNILYYFKMLQ